MAKLFKTLLLLAVIAGAVFFVYQRNQNASAEAAAGISVTVEEVSVRDITPLTLSSGTIIYGDVRRLRPDITAQAERVAVEEGDLVARDQLLIELDTEDYETEYEGAEVAVSLQRLAVERARLNISQTEEQLARQRELVSRNVVGRDTVDSIERQLAFARLDLRTAEQQLKQSETQLQAIQDKLDRAEIRAPIAGIVSALDIKEGEMAVGSTGPAVISVADPGDVQAEVQVNEAKIGNVAVGQAVDVYAVAYPDTPMRGTVEHIATSARPAAGRNGLTFTVKIRIDDDSGLPIKPGMSCRAEIKGDTREDVISVPSMAIQIDEGQPIVWVVENDQVERREVELGEPDLNYQEVLSGLTAGETVVTGPVSKFLLLADGEPVAVQATEE
ncbi:efflux RND transporter periplasmic adaptor subunit [Salinibius halmophilus]|uniref:efflux RND transporter periplasmic adaptor subunit n=1 Tax=Salinibius halmophilus TaxID=1853216 RepID=UPI000E66EDEC|nr:efflux RND transporter periplasmic adaptor subunit [Salinibius halmophilus]